MPTRLMIDGTRKPISIVDEVGQEVDIIDDAGVKRLAVDAVVGAGGAAIDANIQIQNEETVAPLGGGASFTSTSRDYINYESMGVSVYIERDAADTDVDVEVQNSTDGVTWRTADVVNLAVTAASPTATLNRVYSVTREFNRVVLTNNTANGLAETELVTMQKPIA